MTAIQATEAAFSSLPPSPHRTPERHRDGYDPDQQPPPIGRLSPEQLAALEVKDRS